jgi:hypothetical protein
MALPIFSLIFVAAAFPPESADALCVKGPRQLRLDVRAPPEWAYTWPDPAYQRNEETIPNAKDDPTGS